MRGKESRQKIIRTLRGFVLVLAGFNVLIWYGVFSYGASVSDEQKNAKLPVSANVHRDVSVPAAPESIGIPIRISIPSIAVDAAIENVTLAADGSMDVPKRPHDVAWYELGSRPGETGSATIAGHLDWIDGSAAVFANLHKLQVGDKIAVQDDEGSITSFVVRESRRYDAMADAIDVFSSNDGRAHLNIITCDGTWNKRAKQYSKRLVVFADKEGEN